jgi:O-antigen/teichoic acid export membrane protein
VYRFIFGDEFGGIRTVILVLSPGVLFFSLSFVLSSFFSGTGRHHINSISSIAGLIAIVLLSVILIPKYGIVGAGISASISYLITTIIKLRYFKLISGCKTFDLLYKKNDLKNLRSLLKNTFFDESI